MIINDIISPDVQRAIRIPPRQILTKKWPILHWGNVPRVDLSRWTFHIFGQIQERWECDYRTFQAFQPIRVHADMHCVTRWSKLDNVWEGVATSTILEQVRGLPSAKYVMIHAEHGFSTNLSLDDFLGEDCLFAWKHNDKDLDPDHGWPLRLVIPRLYAWKSAKWVRGIELMAENRAGFWEHPDHGGYHMRGDPWTEQRFRDD